MMDALDLSVDAALALLDVFTPTPDLGWDDGPQDDLEPTVHCFIDMPGVMLGADWGYDRVRALIEANGGAMRAGPEASRMGHGVVAYEYGEPRFFATKAPHGRP